MADNGSPTLTHALLAGSLAIDRIAFTSEAGCDPTPITTDQRGISRPQGEGCDLGAFEWTPPPTLDAILDFFDKAVAEGSLIDQGPGRSARNRLNAFRKQLQGLNVQRGRTHAACGRLEVVLKQLDSDSPNVFVTGPAVDELMILLKSWGDELSCR